MRNMASYIKGFVQSILNKGCRRRVNEVPPCSLSPGSYFSQAPPQRTRLGIMLIPLLVVVVAFACLLVDPRDLRQVLVAEGVRPHPGPARGIVKQAVEDIEEAMQQRKRREDREAGREGDVEPESREIQKAKKLRYHLPPQEACGSNASVNQFKDEGKGKLLRLHGREPG